MTKRYKLIIEYNGSGFAGFQRQKDKVSVQSVLENAVFKFTGQKVTIFGSGRTDAGVHAIGQVIHFDLEGEKTYSPHNIEAAMNEHIKPYLISVIQVQEIDLNFHARFSAKMRHYKYIIVNRKSPLILDKDYAWHVKKNLNIDKMILASKIFIGKHDFSSFRANYCQAKSPIKSIEYISIEQEGEKIIIKIGAKSFLHHMVRNIVGSLKEIGIEKITIDDLIRIKDAKDRNIAPATAPACGLFFSHVDY